ncbi:OprD family [Pseudomonas sp. S31]|uniref:OprD family porin n=1 Tax=Pseudomonas sp. S31 TaxID=1564473 RepID=UPI0019132118|nr:OprD family porin [Pseudomonas sp. S31]MBK5002416.1 OprD family [Pseudomonas sp. S31]
MHKTLFAPALALAFCGPLHADFIDDSDVSLTARNFYFSRDFRQSAAVQSKREEWAQGLMFKAVSGYTQGTVGFGLDLYAALGIKLDSSDARGGTGLLPSTFGNSGPDQFSDLSGVFKAKLSKTELKVGGFIPKSPVLLSSDARLLPPLFNGMTLLSKDITNLTVDAGQFNSVNYRNSSGNHDDFIAANYGVSSDRFRYLGLDYQATKAITASAWRAELRDVYRQDFIGLQVNHSAGDWRLAANLGYFDSSELGSQRAGNIDNRLVSGLLSVSHSGHGLKIGYQDNHGRSAFPYLQDTDPNTANAIQILEFTRADERSWQVRYDLDFSTFGVPGLTFFTRYVRGDGYQVAGQNGKEWERDIDLSYVIQSGSLKGLGLRWRNAMVRSDTSVGDIDENRLILSYTLPLR